MSSARPDETASPQESDEAAGWPRAGRRARRYAGSLVEYADDAVLRVPALVESLGARRVLLVCGRRSFEASGAAAMLPALEQVAEVRRWSDFAPNTDAADLVRGLDVLRDAAADLVCGVGGGSAMDMAKLLCAFEGARGADEVESRIRAGETVGQRRPHLAQVPTTSGSGSEATHFAVVYIGEEKFSIAGEGLRADAVVLDPSLARSASAYQRATSGIDAVCQAIESLWARGATDASRAHARRGLGLLLRWIEPFVNDAEPQAARGMCIGSHLAGRAIDVSRTTAAHALSYGLTKRHGVSHGHAVALTLGPMLRAHADAPDDALQPGISPAAHRHAMTEVLTALGAADGADAHERFTALLGHLGLAARLSDVGVGDDDLGPLAATVNTERLGNNPVALDYQSLAGILELAA